MESMSRFAAWSLVVLLFVAFAGVAAYTLRAGVIRGRGLPAFRDLRRKAIDRFVSLGFPTGREEAWRHTDVTPLTQAPFRPATGTARLSGNGWLQSSSPPYVINAGPRSATP